MIRRCGWRSADGFTRALALLQPTLHDPIPPHLIESLTVDTLPATPEHFISEPDSLCEYCLALLQLLLERPAEPKTEQTLTGLLCELVWNFTGRTQIPALAAYRRRRKIYQ